MLDNLLVIAERAVYSIFLDTFLSIYLTFQCLFFAVVVRVFISLAYLPVVYIYMNFHLLCPTAAV